MTENVLLEEFKKRFYKRVDREWKVKGKEIKLVFADVLTDVLLNGGDGTVCVKYVYDMKKSKKKSIEPKPDVGETL